MDAPVSERFRKFSANVNDSFMSSAKIIVEQRLRIDLHFLWRRRFFVEFRKFSANVHEHLMEILCYRVVGTKSCCVAHRLR